MSLLLLDSHGGRDLVYFKACFWELEVGERGEKLLCISLAPGCFLDGAQHAICSLMVQELILPRRMFQTSLLSGETVKLSSR